MSLTPFMFRNPGIVSFLREIDNVFDEFDSPTINGNNKNKLRAIAPRLACDVVENKDSFTIRADLPGIPKDKIEVNIDKNVLTIQAVKEETKADDSETHHIRERSYGRVSRSFQLPTNVLLDSSKCSFDNGALTITFSKNPALETTRKLQIQ